MHKRSILAVALFSPFVLFCVGQAPCQTYRVVPTHSFTAWRSAIGDTLKTLEPGPQDEILVPVLPALKELDLNDVNQAVAVFPVVAELSGRFRQDPDKFASLTDGQKRFLLASALRIVTSGTQDAALRLEKRIEAVNPADSRAVNALLADIRKLADYNRL